MTKRDLTNLEYLKVFQQWRTDISDDAKTMDECGITPRKTTEVLDWVISELEQNEEVTETK